MAIEFDIPELNYFTLEEIAKQWGCSLADVEHYVFDEKTLRLAVPTEVVVTRGASNNLELMLHLFEDEFENMMWRDELPAFLYIDLRQYFNHVEIDGRETPLLSTRLNKGQTLRLRNLAIFEEDLVYLESQEGKEVELLIRSEDVVITTEERDRFLGESFRELREGSEVDTETKMTDVAPDLGKGIFSTVNAKKRSNLLRIAGAFMIALQNADDRYGVETINTTILSECLLEYAPAIYSVRELELILDSISTTNWVAEKK